MFFCISARQMHKHSKTSLIRMLYQCKLRLIIFLLKQGIYEDWDYQVKRLNLKKNLKHKAQLLCQIFLLILNILIKSSNSFLTAKSILIILHLCCTTKNVFFVFRFHVSFITDEVQLVFMLTNSFSAMQSVCHDFSSLIRGLSVYIKFYVLLKSNTLYLHHISCVIPLFRSYSLMLTCL